MAVYRFRSALPRDRRQIRLLLRWFERVELGKSTAGKNTARKLFWPPVGRRFGLGLLLGLLLHGLWSWGGLPLLAYGLLIGGAAALASWLNLYLFADWQNYWVVESDQDLIACSKLTCGKTHAILADVVVSPRWRGQGVGTFLVRSIVEQFTVEQFAVEQFAVGQASREACLNPQDCLPIYLACLPRLMPFYEQFGFRPVELAQLPLALRQELGLRTQPGLRAMVLVLQG